MTTKNTTKGQNYGFAFRRIKEANARGFYVESAAIAESVIADRLHSALLGRGEAFPGKRGKEELRPRLDLLIQRITGYLMGDEGFTEVDLREFQRARNKAVHEIARSLPGSPTISIEEWLEHAKKAATSGSTLARRVAEWHRKQLPIQIKRAKRQTRTHPR